MSPRIGRLAPSPTGILHLGNVRTFMVAWLAARSTGGRVILRIEDLEKPLAGTVLEDILSDLQWLGFDWDEGPAWTPADEAALRETKRYPRARAEAVRRVSELKAGARDGAGGIAGWVSAIGRVLPFAGERGPYIQSLRGDYYQGLFDRLLARDVIYPCTCERADFAGNLGAPHDGEAEPRYPGTCRGRWRSADDARDCLGGREPVWRYRVPGGDGSLVKFADRVRGACEIDVAATVGDFVVFKTARQPAYQLAVVADDRAMGVDQVVRGDDLVSSTARQILLWRALADGDAALPEFGHVPLVVGTDGARLAKRHGDARLHSFRERAVDPRLIIGALAGWSGLCDGRPCGLQDLAGSFDWSRIPRHRLVLDGLALAGLSG